MTKTFWTEVGVLYAAALLGAVAAAPYALRLIKGSGRPLKASPRVLILASLVQAVVLFAIVVRSGAFFAKADGLGAPVIAAALGHHTMPPLTPVLTWGLGLGVGNGLIVTIADLALLPRMPSKMIEAVRNSNLLENFAASFYGGLNEELMTRWFGLSFVAWGLTKVWRTPAGNPTELALWTANIVMAVIFGLAHLPATRVLVGRLTPLVLTRALAFNAPLALSCGWLFWRFGLEAAVIAHFSADVVYHVGGMALLRANDRLGFLPGFPRPPASAT